MSQGRVVAVASMKGGVGKTTVTLNLGYALAQRGWRTLIVDTDPQGSIGLSLTGAARSSVGLVEVLAGEAGLDQAVLGTRLPNLSLLPLGQLAAGLAARWTASLEDGRALRTVLGPLREGWDVILVDTPPGAQGSALGALRQSDAVLAPLQAEPLAARSIAQLLEVVGELRDNGVQTQLVGLVVTMLQSRQRDSLAVAQESWNLFPGDLVLDSTVPRDVAFLEASAAGVPVGLLRRRPPAVAAVFDRLAAELEPRLGLIEEDDDDRAIALLD